MKKRILIVAAHPDDEVLGVGGAAAKHAQTGDIVQTLILGEGITSRQKTTNPKKALENLGESAKYAAKELGLDAPTMLNFPDNRLDSVDFIDIVRPIEDAISKYKPEIVYTHFSADLNIDHRLICEAVIVACRPKPDSSVKSLYSFETVSSTDWAFGKCSRPFVPQRYIDISDVLDKKIAALSRYKSEIQTFPHTRSIEAAKALAQVRGGQAGFHAAEAFEVIFDISSVT